MSTYVNPVTESGLILLKRYFQFRTWRRKYKKAGKMERIILHSSNHRIAELFGVEWILKFI